MSLYPCIMLDGQADEALKYYASFLPEAKMFDVLRAGAGGPGPEGSLIAATIDFRGGRLMVLNGHAAPESFRVSLFLACESQEEVDRFWDALSDGGKPLACSWIADRYGIAWQVAPKRLLSLLADPDPARAKRAMKAMMGMVKIDLNEIERAANSAGGEEI